MDDTTAGAGDTGESSSSGAPEPTTDQPTAGEQAMAEAAAAVARERAAQPQTAANDPAAGTEELAGAAGEPDQLANATARVFELEQTAGRLSDTVDILLEIVAGQIHRPGVYDARHADALTLLLEESTARLGAGAREQMLSSAREHVNRRHFDANQKAAGR